MAGELQLSFVYFSKGSYIVVEGKPNAECFFIIREGQVELSKEVEIVAEERGNNLRPGDFFGVVSAMSGHSYIETARARTDVTLISVQRKQYGQLIRNNAPVAMKILRQFSRRMRYLDQALTFLTLHSSAAVDSRHLYKVAEYYAKQNRYGQAFYACSRYVKYCPDAENIATAKALLSELAPYAQTVRLDFSAKDTEREYPKDAMIFAEGEPGEELFIIKKGSVKITKVVGNNEVLLAVLKTGDVFGEMALLETEPRAASAVAYSECRLTVLNRANFEQTITVQPQLIAYITALQAERIWFIYKQLANTRLSDPLARMYDILLIQLERRRIKVNTRHSFTFDFGPVELTDMIGVSQPEGERLIGKLLKNRHIQIFHDRICVLDVSEIARQTAYLRKMQQIENGRAEKNIFFR
ncbi:MAG: cyclic nucleotide-binding domain-containing protein [Treponema sp.]|jgi:CRP-like cAMP-binding protein|nr:cyclic nucleotide-binding domain-containing protein [Treponema sp.]